MRTFSPGLPHRPFALQCLFVAIVLGKLCIGVPVSASTLVSAAAQGGQKLDLLELELQVLMSHLMWVLGI